MFENFSMPGFLPGTLTAVAIGVATVMFAKNLRRVVAPNMVDVVVGKKDATIYGNKSESGNAYWLWPEWIPAIGRTKVSLPLSVFDIDLFEYDAYDQERVPFVVDIKAFFRIKDATIAGTRVLDMAELEEQLRGILQGTVRTILAKSDIEEALGERSKFGKMFTDQTSDQLAEWGVVNVKTIELMDIRDPKDNSSKVISDIMAKRQSAIERESNIVVAENKRDYRVKQIDAEQVADVREQQAEQLVGERTAEKERAVGVAEERAKQEVQTQAKITADRDMDVVRVKVVREADIKKEARIVKAEEEKVTVIINSEASKQQDIIEAEGQKMQTITVAEGDLADQKMEAEATLAVGKAVAEAARLLEMARVDPELALAEFIGDNAEYQDYLVRIAEVAKNEEVGKEQAKALQKADVKVISNTGETINGVDNVMDLFSSKGGLALGAMIEAAKQTPGGAAVLKALGVEDEGDTNGTGSRI